MASYILNNNTELQIARYASEYRQLIGALLAHIGWEERYITGQLDAVDSFANDSEHCRVFVATLAGAFAGYVSVQFYSWNRLAQIHGLAVEPALQRKGIAAGLVQHAESFTYDKNGRGIYVDTPVTNTGAHNFYLSQGYIQDYIMTAYYADDLDGLTYLKRFTASR